MRSYPSDDHRDEVEKLNAEPWMLNALKLNPEYVHWGPHEDYMWKPGEDEPADPNPPTGLLAMFQPKRSGGWDSRVLKKTWADFGPWGVDEMNECVHFYFSVERASKPCEACKESGYNPETKAISDGFYAHSSPSGRGWNDQITQDEVDYLLANNRLRTWRDGAWHADPVTAEKVNAANGRGRIFGNYDHDAINRSYLIECRAKRLGVYGHCAQCDGHGYIYTEPAAKLGLVLWWLHPRKGCSRGIEVASIARDEMPSVCAFLASAARRNADRFAKVVTEAARG